MENLKLFLANRLYLVISFWIILMARSGSDIYTEGGGEPRGTVSWPLTKYRLPIESPRALLRQIQEYNYEYKLLTLIVYAQQTPTVIYMYVSRSLATYL